MKVLREENAQGTHTHVVASFEMTVFLQLLVSAHCLALGCASLAVPGETIRLVLCLDLLLPMKATAPFLLCVTELINYAVH